HEFVGSRGAVLKITAPKGARGASVAGMSRFATEHEVLFARNSTLKVTGHSRDKEGRLVIEASLSHGAKSRGFGLAVKSAPSRHAAKFGWRAGDVEVSAAAVPGPDTAAAPDDAGTDGADAAGKAWERSGASANGNGRLGY